MFTGRAQGGVARDVRAIEQQPAGIRRLEAGDDAQQRGLAGAGAAEQGEEFTLARWSRSSASSARVAPKRLVIASARSSGGGAAGQATAPP